MLCSQLSSFIPFLLRPLSLFLLLQSLNKPVEERVHKLSLVDGDLGAVMNLLANNMDLYRLIHFERLFLDLPERRPVD